MHTDEDFLRKLLDNPADDTTRLVYADWLDEQDDPTATAKAEFLRLECRMALAPEASLNRIRWQRKLQTLAVNLAPDWLAHVSHPRLEACRLQFVFQCPARWDKLTPTAAPRVRFCEGCRQTVHYCDTLDEARRHAQSGNCVAVSLALVRKGGDLSPQPRPVVAGGIGLTPEVVEHLPVAGRGIRLEPWMIERLGTPGPVPPSTVDDAADEPEGRRPRRKWKRKRGRRERNVRGRG